MPTPQPQNKIETTGQQFFLLGRSMVDSFDPADGSIELCFSSGAAGIRYDRYGEPYIEELEISPEAIESEFLRSGQMAHLLNHNRFDVAAQVGVILANTFRIENGKAFARSKLTDREDVSGIVGDIKKGIIRNISVGYVPKEYRDITGPADTMRRFLVVKWEPVEISTITVPFDKISATRSAEKPDEPTLITVRILESNKEPNNGGSEMPPVDPTPTPAPAPQPPVDTAELARQAAAAEQTRIEEIDRIVSRMELSPEFRTKVVKGNMPIDQVRALAIEEFNAKPSNVPPVQSRIQVGNDLNREGRITGLQNALLNRFDSRKYAIEETGKAFAGMSLLRMSEEIIGGRHGLTNFQIAARALVSSDLSAALGGSLKRLVLDSYKQQSQVYAPFVKPITLSDYKEIKMVRTSSAPELMAVTEKGQYEEGLLGAGSEAMKVLRYGRLITVTEETIVNDDVQLITSIPLMFTNSSARLRARLVFAKLMGVHKMADGVDLFHAGHGNLAGAGGDITEDTLDAGRIAMRSQKEGTGENQDPLGIVPKYLIVGPTREKAARKILATSILPGKAADVNTMQGAFELIVASHITGNEFFLAADPSLASGITIGTLEGMNGPEVETQEDFKSDGLVIKCKDVFGVGVADHRALYKNPGN